MTPLQQALVDELRNAGYAVVIFTPEELGECDASNLEDILVQRGWDMVGAAC